MNEKEKNAIEYLKTRLYGNECCKYIDIAQEDLRIFVNLIDQMKKNINSLEKYSDEQEENIIEKNNNICNLEFQIEKLQKDNEELKNKLSLKQFDINVVYNDYLEKLNEYKENSIPIQKVKEKIGEINKKILNALKYDEKISVYRYQKQILQELLKESEEK